MLCKHYRLGLLLCVVGQVLLQTPGTAQQIKKPRLAILEFEKTGEEIDIPDVEKLVNEWLVGFLVNTNTCDIIERQELEKVLQEQSLGQTGILDQESAANVGNILGVDILVVGKLLALDTLEITTRLLDATNGTILSVFSVQVEDNDELRDAVKELASLIAERFSANETHPNQSSESTPGSYPSLPGWDFWFDEDMPETDRLNTTIRSQDNIIYITGSYQDNQMNREIGIYAAEVPGTHSSLETRLRVHALTGGGSLCASVSWSDTGWAGICPYFEEDWMDVEVAVEEESQEQHEEFERDFRRDHWYTVRIEYTDSQFVFFWEGKPIKRLKPHGPLQADVLEFGLNIIFEETQEIEMEVEVPHLN